MSNYKDNSKNKAIYDYLFDGIKHERIKGIVKYTDEYEEDYYFMIDYYDNNQEMDFILYDGFNKSVFELSLAIKEFSKDEIKIILKFIKTQLKWWVK